MARDITTGVDKIVEAMNKKNIEAQNAQWQKIRNSIDSLLLRNNILKTDQVRRECLLLDGMTHEERMTHIKSLWGPQYLEKVMPLLHQLSMVEKNINKTDVS